jgi:hypothetical protein
MLNDRMTDESEVYGKKWLCGIYPKGHIKSAKNFSQNTTSVNIAGILAEI